MEILYDLLPDAITAVIIRNPKNSSTIYTPEIDRSSVIIANEFEREKTDTG
jgi:hypothetical protein